MATFKQNYYRALKECNVLYDPNGNVTKFTYSLYHILQHTTHIDTKLYKNLINKFLFKGKHTIDIKVTTNSEEEKTFIDFCIKNDIRWASGHSYNVLVAWRSFEDADTDVCVTLHDEFYTTWGNDSEAKLTLSVEQFIKQFEDLKTALDKEADKIFLIHGNTTTECLETVEG